MHVFGFLLPRLILFVYLVGLPRCFLPFVYSQVPSLGNLIKVVIPRPDPSGLPVAGVGKVSLVYCIAQILKSVCNLSNVRPFHPGFLGVCRCGRRHQSKDGNAWKEVRWKSSCCSVLP